MLEEGGSSIISINPLIATAAKRPKVIIALAKTVNITEFFSDVTSEHDPAINTFYFRSVSCISTTLCLHYRIVAERRSRVIGLVEVGEDFFPSCCCCCSSFRNCKCLVLAAPLNVNRMRQ